MAKHLLNLAFDLSIILQLNSAIHYTGFTQSNVYCMISQYYYKMYILVATNGFSATGNSSRIISACVNVYVV